MNKRILCCVETTKQADTDYQYIRETIRQFYVESSKIVIRPIYMQSKSRYNSRTVTEQIRKQSTNNTDTTVIYFIDTDDWDISVVAKKELDEIKAYCDANGYEFVFFCKDVEDVYWGRRVSDTEKVSAITKFKSSHTIQRIKQRQLEKVKYQVHCSNIMKVLDKHFTRK